MLRMGIMSGISRDPSSGVCELLAEMFGVPMW